MIPRRLLFPIIALVALLQLMLLGFGWLIIVEIAEAAGRRQRGGISFGVSIRISTLLFPVAALLGGIFSVSQKGFIIRVLSSMPVLILWASFTVAPLLSDYPYRAGAFLILASLIFLAGSIFLLPFVVARLDRTKIGEQCAAAEPDRAGG